MESPPPVEQSLYPPQQPMGYYPSQVDPSTQPPVTTQPSYGSHSTHTTVVLQQQPVVVTQAARNWSTGLCGCFEDCSSCFMGCFCPGMLLLDVSSRMGEGCCFPCCCPGALLGLRIKLRVQENIQGSLMNDYMTVQCCPVCVLCQLARELNHTRR